MSLKSYENHLRSVLLTVLRLESLTYQFLPAEDFHTTLFSTTWIPSIGLMYLASLTIMVDHHPTL